MALSFPRLRRLRSTLPLLAELLMVGVFFALDLRDLYYKIAYIGPTNNFAYYALTQRTLQAKSLVATMALSPSVSSNEVVSTSPRASGWPSLLANCEHLQPVSAFFFIGAMGFNCTVGTPANATKIPQLYLSSSARADSMAWAGCKLLYRHRRPRICFDEIVTGFTDRYGFDGPDVSPTQLALPASDAEHELLALLEVIAKSEPLYATTCVEGFAYDGPGFYTTHIYGCGAPNVFASAFVGVKAKAFREFHQDKAWLTVDSINLMGFKYVLRQNVKSEFTTTINTETGAVLLAPKTVTNFSSSGSLYCLMIVIDVVLMIYNLWSGIEIARLMVLPLLEAHVVAKNDPTNLQGVVEDYKAVLTCPLYRSRPIVLLTVATQLISWVILLPNSIIFTWSTSSKIAEFQAYLSSLRLWTLLLLLLNEIWDWVVLWNERLAYMVSSHTYIASWEIIVVGAAVSYVRRLDLFAVTGAKYAIERQRYTDATSFVGTKAFGNSYNPQLDGSQSTPTYVLRTIYRPLVEILLWSLLSICSILLLRFLVFRLWIRCRSWRRQQVAKVRAVVAKAEDESNDEGAGNQLFKKRGDIGGSTHRPAEPTTASNISEEQSEYEKYEDELYTRLPIEELLNIPIRALSLVRGGLAMETTGDRGQRFVRTPLMAEHGVVLDKGRLRVRHGFFCNLQPDIELDRYLPRKVRSVLSSIDLNGRAKNT